MGLIRKFYKVKLEDVKDEGSYIAYISAFGDKDNVDKDGDFFSSSAFDKTIKKRKGIFPGIHQHDFRKPVAIGRVEKDSKGLIVHAQLNLDTQIGNETHSNMQMGIMGDHSIGFNPNRKMMEDILDDNDRLTGFGFNEVELLEFSPLTIGFAANDEAILIDLKNRKSLFITDGVDSIEPVEVDSLEQAKEMEALNAKIKGLTADINQYNGRR